MSNFYNKVLELFEAKILFKLSNKEIDIRVVKKFECTCYYRIKKQNDISNYAYCKYEIPISNALNLKNNFKINFDDKMFSLLSPNKKISFNKPW